MTSENAPRQDSAQPDQPTCPKCGAAMPPEAPAGLCPKCLMEAGLGSQSDALAGSPVGEPTAPSPSEGRFVPPAPDELAPLFPQLEIVELIGSGGMGAVYKARQPHLDRIVALKILPPQLAEDPAFEERFTREARVLARLSHPNVVVVYDFGRTDAPLSAPGREAGGEGQTAETAGRLYYFVMEYVDGTNLRELIRAGKLQPEEALAIVPQICDALQYAHDQGVVHRDIKPENILIDRRGRVKIADFGLARIAGQPPAGEAAAVGKEWTLTATGQVMGTLHYMAPEQMKGSHSVDHRADIYSLGVVFYEMLTGELPIGKFEPPSRKVRVDVRLDEVVLRALESEPQRRYQKASDVKTDVERVSSQWSRPSQVPSPLEGFQPDLEQAIVALLPQQWTDAIKLCRQRTGKGIDESAMIVEAIAKKHGIELPRWPVRRRLAVAGLMTVMFAVMGALYFVFFHYVHLSSVVKGLLYYVFMALVTAYFAISAWRFRKYRSTTRYQGLVLVAGLFCFAFLVAPLLEVLAEPEPILNYLYQVSGAKPGEHDVALFHAFFAAVIFGMLGWLIWFWRKLRTSKTKFSQIDLPPGEPSVAGAVDANHGVKSSSGSANRSATASAVDGDPLRQFFRFWMTPQPGFAGWVGVPMLIALVLWIAALVIEMLPGTTLLPGREPEGWWLLIGLCGLPVLFLVLTLVWVVHGRRPADSQRTAAVRRLVLLGAFVLSFLIVAAFRPEISGAVWTVVMGLTAVAFVVDAFRYRSQRRGQAAMFALLAGLAAVAIYLVVQPQPFLQWLYQITGYETPGRHDATFLRAISGLILCWLVWQFVQVGRRVGNFTVVALVGAGMILLLTMIALMRMSGQATAPSTGRHAAQGATGTIREVALSEAEQNTPGLSIYRYELHLPPGNWKCEVWTELWKDGQRSRGPIHLPTVRNPKRFELQWREGEALSPEGEGKVRWDFFGATAERALVLDHDRDRYEEPEAEGKQSTGNWIDDPFAEVVGRQSTWGNGTNQWPLVPGEERTLLILRGYKGPAKRAPTSGSDPNQLARRIEQENAHADVELYLKLSITPAQPAPSGADQDK